MLEDLGIDMILGLEKGGDFWEPSSMFVKAERADFDLCCDSVSMEENK
jgi:hypothetical protein